MVEPDPRGTSRERQLPVVEETAVVLVPHDPHWTLLYLQEAPVVMSAFRERRATIEHFGSTAVPGLVAKPIIDILVGSIDGLHPSAREIEALETQNYVFLGEDGRRPGRWFWRKRGQLAFNLSLVPLMSDLWEDNLAVRDYLRAHPKQVQQYAEVKLHAVRLSPNSLLGYQNHKRAFMQELRKRAREWADAQGRRARSEA
jgi:GrpB-like predicted nucleotidyltransferase (UPF0157 family)